MSRKYRCESSTYDDSDGYDKREPQLSKKAHRKHLDKTHEKYRYSDDDSTHHRHKKIKTKYDSNDADRTKSKSKDFDRNYTDENQDDDHKIAKSRHDKYRDVSSAKSKVNKDSKHERRPYCSDENAEDDSKEMKSKLDDYRRSKNKVKKNASSSKSATFVDEDKHDSTKKSKSKHESYVAEVQRNKSKSNKKDSYERIQVLDYENPPDRRQSEASNHEFAKERKSDRNAHYDEANRQDRFEASKTKYDTVQKNRGKIVCRENKSRVRDNSSDDESMEQYNKNAKRRKASHSGKAENYRTVNEANNNTSDIDNGTDDVHQDTSKSKKINDEPQSKRVQIQTINLRTGGAYIPPAKLKMMQDRIKDKGSEEYQRIAWEALKKSIVGMTNKVNVSNIIEIVPELFKENIIRGRGILSRAIIQAQAASPSFTRVYAALMSIINTKFPEIGELILKRLIIQYRRGFRRNDKAACLSACRFVAHLFNQEIAHEILILEMLTHLLENPTEDSVEIAIALLKECGEKLTKLSKHGMRAVTDRIRSVLHDAKLDVRVKYMIEVFFAVQKDGFKDYAAVPSELDLVEEDDKYTHLINLDEVVDGEDILNVFKFDSNYIENEEKYKSVVKEILGDSSGSEESGDDPDDENEDDEGGEKKLDEDQQIIDMTETNIVCLRRKIYLTIQSSLDFEECAHKLLKLELKPGQILEMCYMILDCCAQQRTYEKFFGLLAQRFCQINKVYAEPFTEIFENSYKTIHRLETNKLRNVANFFAHLLYTDAISWMVLSNIRLNEEDTSSSSRVFIKILFQELCEYMSLTKLNERVKDVTFQEAFDGLFPRDHPHNTRFAINFFTSIGLGGLTDELREHLKNMPKKTVNPVTTTTDLSASQPPESSSSKSDSEIEDRDSLKKNKKHKKKSKKKGK